MADPDEQLRKLTDAIIAGDHGAVTRMLGESPELARAVFQTGASREAESAHFRPEIGRYVWAGDTALHIAAAAYRSDIVQSLIAVGANVRAKNRLGDEPLHSAAAGDPNSLRWDPEAQAATIVCLIAGGADPNAMNKTGAAPLHRAIRSRCATAVRTLLERGADAQLKNKRGSSPMVLATHNTGRGGTGSPRAISEQLEIVRMLAAAT